MLIVAMHSNLYCFYVFWMYNEHQGLEIEVCDAKTRFCISGTKETRHKQVNSLKACKLQSQLTISEPGASFTTFQKVVDSSCGPVVSYEAVSCSLFQLMNPSRSSVQCTLLPKISLREMHGHTSTFFGNIWYTRVRHHDSCSGSK